MTRSAHLARPKPGWPVTYRVELAKLSAQVRVRSVLLACLLGPVLFAVGLAAQTGVPTDTLFGRWVHDSGFALPLVVLGFSGQWALPVLVAVLAGDICAGEDRHGTWSTLLTRSRGRGEVLAGKLLAVATFTVLAVSCLAVSSTAAGVLGTGTKPLEGLSGTLLPSTTALRVVIEAWATALPPTLAVAGIAVVASLLSRNSWVGVMVPVIGVLFLDLITLLSALDPIRPLLPTTGYDAWHGLARADTYSTPVLTSIGVSLGWIVISVVLADRILTRRDIHDQ